MTCDGGIRAEKLLVRKGFQSASPLIEFGVVNNEMARFGRLLSSHCPLFWERPKQVVDR